MVSKQVLLDCCRGGVGSDHCDYCCRMHDCEVTKGESYKARRKGGVRSERTTQRL